MPPAPSQAVDPALRSNRMTARPAEACHRPATNRRFPLRRRPRPPPLQSPLQAAVRPPTARARSAAGRKARHPLKTRWPFKPPAARIDGAGSPAATVSQTPAAALIATPAAAVGTTHAAAVAATPVAATATSAAAIAQSAGGAIAARHTAAVAAVNGASQAVTNQATHGAVAVDAGGGEHALPAGVAPGPTDPAAKSA